MCCSSGSKIAKETTPPPVTIKTEAQTTIKFTLPHPDEVGIYEAKGLQAAYELPYLPIYRAVYYPLPGDFIFYVDQDKSNEFMRYVDENHRREDEHLDEMVLKLFVEYFQIPIMRNINSPTATSSTRLTTM